MERQEKNIEFLGGNISAKNKSEDIAGVKIKSADTVISLDDASINLQGTEGNLDLSVVEGNIGLSKGDKIQEVKANQKALLSEGSDDFLINEITIRPDIPEDNMYFLTFDNKKAVNFRWNFLNPIPDPSLKNCKRYGFQKNYI